jgi:hypothetical protein
LSYLSHQLTDFCKRSNAIGWFLTPETQAQLQLVKVLRFISWRTWLIGLLIIIIFIVIEGSFSINRKRKTEYEQKVRAVQGDLDMARAEIETEKAHSSLSNIGVQIQEVHTENTFSMSGKHPNYIDYYITLKVRLKNRGLRQVSPTEFILEVVTNEGILTTEQVPLDYLAIRREQRVLSKIISTTSEVEDAQENLQDISKNAFPIPVGDFRPGWIRFVIPNASPEQIGEIKAITLKVIDALDTPHTITVNKTDWRKSGELINLPEQEFIRQLEEARRDSKEQKVLQLRTEEKSDAMQFAEPPKLIFECVKAAMIDIAINISSSEIISTPTDKDLKCKAAIVELRRQTDESAIEWIDILITAELKTQNGELIMINPVRCLDHDWRMQGLVRFHRLDRRRLAVILAISANNVSTYEGRYVRRQGFYPDIYGPSYMFVHEFQELTEASYDVELRLIGTQDGKVIIDKVFSFDLTRGPTFSDIVFRQKEYKEIA